MSRIGFDCSFRRQTSIGFAGWVTYEMKNRKSEWNAITCMLAKYAEFANVGGNRTGGFGVTRLALKYSNLQHTPLKREAGLKV